MIVRKLKNTRVRVAGVLLEEGRLLLIAHKKKKDVYWLLPGGGVDYGESLAEALKRELREELSIEASVHDIVFVCDSIGPGLERHIVNICFYCTRETGDLSLGKERRLHDFNFFDAAGLDEVIIFPPMRDELKSVLGGGGDGRTYIGKRWMEL
ncbi:MAG: NUDIX domain-containing protein [Spirochaetes bacterium]|nr:NUDIX domain-containing protein [Spirochaetota bacterium]